MRALPALAVAALLVVAGFAAPTTPIDAPSPTDAPTDPPTTDASTAADSNPESTDESDGTP